MNPLFLNSFLVWITTEDTSLEGGGGESGVKKVEEMKYYITQKYNEAY